MLLCWERSVVDLPFTLAFLMGGTYNRRFAHDGRQRLHFHSSLSDGRDLQCMGDAGDVRRKSPFTLAFLMGGTYNPAHNPTRIHQTISVGKM